MERYSIKLNVRIIDGERKKLPFEKQVFIGLEFYRGGLRVIPTAYFVTALLYNFVIPTLPKILFIFKQLKC